MAIVVPVLNAIVSASHIPFLGGGIAIGREPILVTFYEDDSRVYILIRK
jgi:hypothetical protein